MSCDTCHFAKQNKCIFSISSTVSICLFDIIHIDIGGPYHVLSILATSYFLTIVDDKSPFTWINLMKTKFETRDHLKNFVTLIHT